MSVKNIHLPKQEYNKYYLLKQHKRNQLGSLFYENKVETQLCVKLVKIDIERYLYRIQIIDRKYSSKHPLSHLEAEFINAQNSILAEVDKTGKVIKVTNINSIQQRWKQLKYELPYKYKNIKEIKTIVNKSNELVWNTPLFMQSLIRSDIIRLFFSGIYGDYDKIYRKGEVIFSAMIGEYDLPISTNSKVTRQDENITEIRTNGCLNEDKYEEEKIRRMLRILYDKYNLRTKINIKYKEIHELDKHQILKYSGQLFFAAIPGVFFSENITHISPIELKNQKL